MCPRARRSYSRLTASRPSVHEKPPRAASHTIDATCPLVTKVHMQARRYAAAGYTIVLIGHAGHEEIEGTMGEAPESIVLVESIDDARPSSSRRRERSPTSPRRRCRSMRPREIIPRSAAASRNRRARSKEDICYATSNRQWAVKEMLQQVEMLLVIGSKDSSNSNRSSR